MAGRHTSLPWRIVKYGDGDSLVIHDARGDWRVCFMATPSENGDCESIEANAEFIVRACNSHDELVEALEGLEESGTAIIAAIDRYNAETGSDLAGGVVFKFARAVGNARAAIAKAKGEDQ